MMTHDHSSCAHHAGTAPTAAADASSSTALQLLPAEIAGVRIPDSPLAQVVTGLVREASPQPLFNHVARSFVFGSTFGAFKGLKYDPELFFVAALMHDLGLTERYTADARFEVDGADAAAAILRERGYPESKIDIVWEAIALHASMEIAPRRSPEVALVHIGTFMDAGANADKFPAAFFDQVFEALPSLGNMAHLIESFGNVLRRKPHTAYLAFQTDIARRTNPDFNPPNFCDIPRQAPFNG